MKYDRLRSAAYGEGRRWFKWWLIFTGQRRS